MIKAVKRELMVGMRDHIVALNMTQREAAKKYHTTQKRIWEIMNLKHTQFSIEKLIEFAGRMGMHPKLRIE